MYISQRRRESTDRVCKHLRHVFSENYPAGVNKALGSVDLCVGLLMNDKNSQYNPRIKTTQLAVLFPLSEGYERVETDDFGCVCVGRCSM
jgi:hypothetical protein